MKTILIAAAALCLQVSAAWSANISTAGIDGTDGGLLKIENDPYWWFCIQPDGSEGPIGAPGGTYQGDVVSLDYGWTRQTTERFTFVGTATPQAQADLSRQINVIEYVLDTYLPWSETSDRFLENVGTPPESTNQGADTNFFNRLYAVQQYVKKLHGKLYEDNTAFTSLSIYSPTSDFPLLTAADVARTNFFNTIKADVNTKAASGFFDSYAPMHNYAIVNTFYSATDPLDYQDAIVIGTSAIPEPSSVLLGLGTLLVLGNRRRRA
jgi:hypothetical protein